MLNELYALSNVLRSTGIDTIGAPIPEYVPLPRVKKNAPCLRLWLKSDGKVGGIEELGTELVSTLRKYGNNQASFPAFNIAPLFRITDKQQINEVDEMIKNNALFDFHKVQTWCVNDNWNEKKLRTIYRCLNECPNKLLRILEMQDVVSENPMSELIYLVNSYLRDNDHNFRSLLEEYVLNKLKLREDVSTLLFILFHKGDQSKKSVDDSGSLSIILDIYDWHKYEYPVASASTSSWLYDILLKSYTRRTTPIVGQDAFGAAFSVVGKRMPSVRLQKFDVTLRSMFSEHKCQLRYGVADDASYPIAVENRNTIGAALEWISEPEKEGIMWNAIDENELVFVYPSTIPTVPVKLASLFGSSRIDKSIVQEARFEAVSKRVIRAINGLLPEEKPRNIQLFLLRQIVPLLSKRAKVTLNRNFTTDWLLFSAENWQNGCYNIPSMDFSEKLTPFPLQVSRIVNNVWKQSGELANQEKTEVKRMQHYQGIELLLDHGQQNMIQYYLRILLSHSLGLFKYLGNSEHSGKKVADKSRMSTAYVLSVLGLLLYKSGYTKEVYMENAAYLVGQILKISDGLHAYYCKIVRDGSIPPQLAGNAMFVAATETPVQALAQLGTRMAPYIAWATQYQTKCIKDEGKKSGLAGWYLGLYQDISDKLHKSLSDTTRFDDFGKAQVFLGYLASLPKREKSAADDAANEDDTMNGAEGEQK